MKYQNYIKEIRIRRNISQTDLAKKVGIDRSSLARIEAGNRKIPKDKEELFCIVLDISLEELFGSEYKREIDNELLEYSISVIDSVTDSSTLTKKQRLDLARKVYSMMSELLEKELTPEEVDEEVKILKEKTEAAVKEMRLARNNIFENLKQKLSKN